MPPPCPPTQVTALDRLHSGVFLRNTRTNRGVGSLDPGRTRPLRGPTRPLVRPQTPNISNRLDPPPPGTGRTSLEIRYPPPPFRAAGSDHGRLRPQRLRRPRASASLRQSHTSALTRGLRLGYGLTSGPQDSDQARQGKKPILSGNNRRWRGEGLTGFGRWMKAGTDGSVRAHPDGQGWPSPQMVVVPSPSLTLHQ